MRAPSGHAHGPCTPGSEARSDSIPRRSERARQRHPPERSVEAGATVSPTAADQSPSHLGSWAEPRRPLFDVQQLLVERAETPGGIEEVQLEDPDLHVT